MTLVRLIQILHQWQCVDHLTTDISFIENGKFVTTAHIVVDLKDSAEIAIALRNLGFEKTYRVQLPNSKTRISVSVEGLA